MELKHGYLKLSEIELKKMTVNFNALDKVEALNKFNDDNIIDHLYNINQYYTDGLDLINDLYKNHDFIAFKIVVSYDEYGNGTCHEMELLTENDVNKEFEEMKLYTWSDYAIYKAYEIKPKTKEEELWLASFEEKYHNLKIDSY